MNSLRTGGSILARDLRERGIGVVYGVAGAQNVTLLEELRRAGLRLMSGTSELSSAFMATGHARLTRKPSILTTIPGPGFAYALPAIAEARLDSVPLVWISLAPEASPDGRPVLQAIPQTETAGPLVKEVLTVREAGAVRESLSRALEAASTGEPGPVLLQVAPAALRGSAPDGADGDRGIGPLGVPASGLRAPLPEEEDLARVIERLRASRRPVLYAGQGVLDAPAGFVALAERLRAPVITTTSARGVVSEHHPLVMPADRPGEAPRVLNELLEQADLVLALGCGFSHNGSCGFRVAIPTDRLVHVNASPRPFGPPYPPALALRSDVRTVLDAIEGVRLGSEACRGWSAGELRSWRERMAPPGGREGEPLVPGVPNGSMQQLFATLRAALPRDAVLVTDSGRHQMLVRRHFRVLSPGGLVVPADFQSMGFGLPAAIGARIAAPERKVVAVLGDGGLLISAAELLVASRERVDLAVLVFSDGELGLIADQQRREHGRATATSLGRPSLAALARSFDCGYMRLDGSRPAERVFGEMQERPGPTLVDIPLVRSARSRMEQARSLAHASLRSGLGPAAVRWLKRSVRREE